MSQGGNVFGTCAESLAPAEKQTNKRQPRSASDDLALRADTRVHAGVGIHVRTKASLASPTQPLTFTGQRRPQTGSAWAGDEVSRPVAQVAAVAVGVATAEEAVDAGSPRGVLGVKVLDLGPAVTPGRPGEVCGAGGVDRGASTNGAALSALLAVEKVLAPGVDAVQALVQTRLVHPQRHRHRHRRLQHQHHGHHRRHLHHQHC